MNIFESVHNLSGFSNVSFSNYICEKKHHLSKAQKIAKMIDGRICKFHSDIKESLKMDNSLKVVMSYNRKENSIIGFVMEAKEHGSLEGENFVTLDFMESEDRLNSAHQFIFSDFNRIKVNDKKIKEEFYFITGESYSYIQVPLSSFSSYDYN